MAAFLSDLTTLTDFVFSILTSIFSLYTTCYVLIAVLGIWIVRRVFKLFDMIRP